MRNGNPDDEGMSRSRKDQAPTRGEVNQTRRVLNKAALAAVPMMLTLSSRPVWAGCISNMLSYNPSGYREVEEDCAPTGHGPLYWRDNPGDWPSAGVEYGACDKEGGCSSCQDYKGGTKFRELFPGGSDVPVRTILCTDPESYLAYCAAAYLNAMSMGDGYSITFEQVMGIWEGTVLGELSQGEIMALLAQTWT